MHHCGPQRTTLLEHMSLSQNCEVFFRLHPDICVILVWKFSFMASQVAQTIKNLHAIQETWVWSLGQEGRWQLEKGMATHSSILAWRIPWTEEPGGLQSMGSHWAGHDWETQHPHNERSKSEMLHVGETESISGLGRWGWKKKMNWALREGQPGEREWRAANRILQ